MRNLFAFIVISLSLYSCSADQEKRTNTAAKPPIDTVQPNTAAPLSAVHIDTTRFEYIDGTLKLTWKMLSDVVFTDEFSEEVQAYVPYPTFGATLQAIEGREVIVEGYIIPLEETGDETILVLSAQPYSSCFFCGGAGPESVMDIKLRPGAARKFITDERLSFRGKLRLNDDDLYYLNYILEDAEVYP